MSAPALRFKNETGQEFPEWTDCAIGDMVSQQSKKCDPANTLEDFPCIELEHISQGTGQLLGCVDVREQKSLKSRFSKGDVLFGKLRPYLRKYLKAPFDGACSTEIWVLKGSKITNDFLFQYVQAERFLTVANISSGSKMPRADWSVVASEEAAFPSLPEQTKIANFLTAVDEKLAQLTRKHDLLTQYKKGVMQQIFSQELRFKDDDGREFEEWKEMSLKAVTQIVGGGTPETGVNEYWNGDIQWFTPTELKSKYATRSKRTITEAGLKNSSAKILPVGTLLFSSRATVGDVSIALYECKTNQGFQSLIVNEQHNNQFIYYWILNNKNAFLEKASGSTFLEISKKEIEKLPIRVPVLAEQTKIANFFTAIDDKITATKNQLDAVKQYKQGLLQQMFV